jgi:hypothetical protein
MIPPNVYHWCRNGKSVVDQVAANPSEAPSQAAKRLFGVNIEQDLTGEHLKDPETGQTKDDLQHAFECGNWGPSRPSDLFLQVRCPASTRARRATALLNLCRRTTTCSAPSRKTPCLE